MSEKEKMSSEELEKVSGGLSDEDKKNIHDAWEKMVASQGYVDMKCQYCGNTFQYSKFLLVDWNGIDIDGRHYYDVHTCPECKKTHPFVSLKEQLRKGLSKENS